MSLSVLTHYSIWLDVTSKPIEYLKQWLQVSLKFWFYKIVVFCLGLHFASWSIYTGPMIFICVWLGLVPLLLFHVQSEWLDCHLDLKCLIFACASCFLQSQLLHTELTFGVSCNNLATDPSTLLCQTFPFLEVYLVFRF